MPAISVQDTIDDVRDQFGPRFVAARREAEDAVRAYLDEHLGRMTPEDILALGRLINRHEKAGQQRLDRFVPGFSGAIMKRLGEDPATFNDMVSQLWRAPTAEAEALLGRIFADRRVFPHAGSSLPSFLLYLRAPDQYGICVNATMLGLGIATGQQYRADGLASYRHFCADLRKWQEQYTVTAQEADAVLARMMRVARTDAALPDASVDSDRLSTEEVAARCHLDVEQVDRWVEALSSKLRQATFHGPPGTGKTHVALLLARHLATSPEHIELVQFHPAYSYEDFIEGLRPVANADGLRYEVRPGVFARLCERAERAPAETFVLVIDEMNRADLAAVFGELLALLEYRGTIAVTLPYSQRRLSVPVNIVVLGTMNTADRSLALLDFALRRRFHAFPLLPDETVLSRWAERHVPGSADLAVGVFRLIRDRVGAGTPVSPGHSYWMTEALDGAAAERIWDYQLRPYLAEFWFEQPAELDRLDADVRALIAELA